MARVGYDGEVELFENDGHVLHEATVRVIRIGFNLRVHHKGKREKERMAKGKGETNLKP